MSTPAGMRTVRLSVSTSEPEPWQAGQAAFARRPVPRQREQRRGMRAENDTVPPRTASRNGIVMAAAASSSSPRPIPAPPPEKRSEKRSETSPDHRKPPPPGAPLPDGVLPEVLAERPLRRPARRGTARRRARAARPCRRSGRTAPSSSGPSGSRRRPRSPGSACAPPASPRFTSGWDFLARRRYAFLISASLAVRETPRTSYGSFIAMPERIGETTARGRALRLPGL